MPHLHQLLNEDDIEQLQSKLAFAEIFSTSSDSDFIPGLTIARKEHTKVRIRPERNHPRAHFHIEYKREHSASYAIDNLERLAGYMPTKYERPILEWAAERRLSLQATWDELAAGKI